MNKNHSAKPSPSSAPKMEARSATSSLAPVRSNEKRPEPTHEQIARRAYEIYLARGGQPGDPNQDWAQAERELRLGR